MDPTFERKFLLAWRRAMKGVVKIIEVRLSWLQERRRSDQNSKRSYEERSQIAWRRGLRGIIKTIENRIDSIDKDHPNNSRGT